MQGALHEIESNRTELNWFSSSRSELTVSITSMEAYHTLPITAIEAECTVSITAIEVKRKVRLNRLSELNRFCIPLAISHTLERLSFLLCCRLSSCPSCWHLQQVRRLIDSDCVPDWLRLTRVEIVQWLCMACCGTWGWALRTSASWASAGDRAWDTDLIEKLSELISLKTQEDSTVLDCAG